MYSWKCKGLGGGSTHLLDVKASIKGKGSGFKVLEPHLSAKNLRRLTPFPQKQKRNDIYLLF